MKKITLFLLLSTFLLNVYSQWDYRVEIVPDTIENLPALHSYVFAQQENEYLIIGGRKDGIHPRQPFAAFNEADKNTKAFVINPKTKQVWESNLSGLSTSLIEQLSSTNMNFHQEKDTLYIIGGYGYSPSAADHKTYDYITTLLVSQLITAIKSNASTAPFFKQTQYAKFAVTGGHLAHMDGKFYLVGGHRFDGRYNPMGNATYTQEYTNEVRIFKINNSGSAPVVFDYQAIRSEDHLHRRDYNLVPQIYPDGSDGFLISSGVFQKSANLPFLYPVQVHDTFITPIIDFNQYLSHYHSASIAFYDSQNKEMHSLFLGGLSQYDYENEKLIKDDLVPFVKTISLLTQNSKGNYSEYKLNQNMPALLGSSAEFFFNPEIPQVKHEIIDLQKLSGDTVLLGYVFGGIESNTQNPFSNNTISQTRANPTLYKVKLIKDALAHTDYLKKIPDVTVFPNPNTDGKVKIQFPFDVNQATVNIYNNIGALVQNTTLKPCNNSGMEFEIDPKIPAQILYLHILGPDGQTYRKKLVWRNYN